MCLCRAHRDGRSHQQRHWHSETEPERNTKPETTVTACRTPVAVTDAQDTQGERAAALKTGRQKLPKQKCREERRQKHRMSGNRETSHVTGVSKEPKKRVENTCGVPMTEFFNEGQTPDAGRGQRGERPVPRLPAELPAAHRIRPAQSRGQRAAGKREETGTGPAYGHLPDRGARGHSCGERERRIPRVRGPAKPSPKSQGEIKAFSDKQGRGNSSPGDVP